MIEKIDILYSANEGQVQSQLVCNLFTRTLEGLGFAKGF